MGKNCGRGLSCGNGILVDIILFILMAIVLDGRLFL